MNVDLNGLNVLVTGASRGIGRAIAEEMIRSGATVGVHYNRNKEAAEEIVRGSDGGSKVFGADLESAESCHELFSAVLEAFGRIDVLVNNAGVAVYSPVESPLEEYARDWHRTLSVNLVSTAILCRDAVLHFRTIGGGRIINIASRAAFRGDTSDMLAYAASKGGMVSLSRSIARAYGKDGIKSFVIAPGFTRTDMAEDFIRKFGEEIALRDVALDRMTEPQDIAPLAVLLASGLADHASGTSIDVNAASYVR